MIAAFSNSPAYNSAEKSEREQASSIHSSCLLLLDSQGYGRGGGSIEYHTGMCQIRIYVSGEDLSRPV
ncbi:MAG: hypothetical protein UZ16_OP3001003225 [Candidatus Hinthialibacteria bacterium OLB16]|nr:MAG: hypothetical protein UZ16_OP3001003225 [Candidatus Hinthialibacteria bacterium OLB16]